MQVSFYVLKLYISNFVSLKHLTETGKSSLRGHKAEGGIENYVKDTFQAAEDMAFWGKGPLLILTLML